MTTNYTLTVEARDSYSVETAAEIATRLVVGDPVLAVTTDVVGDEVNINMYATGLVTTEQELVDLLELLLDGLRNGEDLTDAQ